MAYMCADSGNLMAIAQQVIQQKQQRQQQQQQQQQMAVAAMPQPPPWPDAAAHIDPAPDHFPFSLHDSTPPFVDPFDHLPYRLSTEFDHWMDGSDLITDSLFADSFASDLDGVLFSSAPPKTSPPLPAAPLPVLPLPLPPKTLPSSPPLLKSLVECAGLVESDPDLAIKSLAQIRDSTSDVGDATQRVAFYFAQGLFHCLMPPQSSFSSSVDYSSEEFALSYKALNDACPYSKFAHLTANQAILEATESADRIHIVDFGIVQGIQWPALLQALATRPAGKPSKVRISGIPSPSLGDAVSKSSLVSTGKRLSKFASSLELEFEFHPILTPVRELSKSTFQVELDESVVVNFMLQLHQLLDDSLDSVQQVLRLAKSLGPSVVTLCEYELSSNQVKFPNRVENALHHFKSVFESLEPAMGRDSKERSWLERNYFGHRILEVVGQRGPGDRRLRMEGKDRWRAAMDECGFKSLPASNYAVSQAKLLLFDYNYSPKYSLLDSCPGFLSLAWNDNPIITVSSWR